MATGQAGEAGFDKINQRLDELNNKFDRLVRESEQANKAIASMGDTFEKLGVQMGNVASVTDIFEKVKDSAIKSIKDVSTETSKVLNDITASIAMLPQVFSKDIKFIDTETLIGQKQEALSELKDFTKQRKDLMNQMKDIESNIQLPQNVQSLQIAIEQLEKQKEISNEQKNRLNFYKKIVQASRESLLNENEVYNTLKNEVSAVKERISQKKEIVGNIQSQEQFNVKIVEMAANYEAAKIKIQELKNELATLAASDKAARVSKVDGEYTISLTEEAKAIQDEINLLENENAIRKPSYELMQRMYENQRQQNQAVADMVNEELRLKNLKQQQLVNEVKANYAEEQKKKNLEEQNRIEQENLEIAKKIADVKQKNVSSLSVVDLRNTFSQLEETTKKMRELEAAGKSNSKEFRQQKELFNAYKKQLRDAGLAMDGFKNAATKAKTVMQSLASQFGIVFSVSGILKFMQNIIKITGEFELQEKALGAIIQNQQKANDMFYKLQIMATKSPYNIQQLVSYNRQLAAYRVETEKLLPTMKMLGDVAAGVGVDMQRLILAYGQVKAANYLRGQELRQFSEAGINILGELADKFTEVEGKAVSTGEVFERVSKRMVTFEDVNEVFERLTQKGGIFYEMQQKQAETLRGQIKNLSDAFKIEANKMGSTVSDKVKTAVSIIKVLMKNLSSLVSIIKAVGVAYAAIKVSRAWADTKTIVRSLNALRQEEKEVKVLGYLWQKATKSVREYYRAVQFGSKSAKGFAAFMKGGGWAAALTIAIAGAYKLLDAYVKLRKEIAEVQKKRVETFGMLDSEQFFGRRKSGDKKTWLDTYNSIDTLADKFDYVDQMLEKLRERGIDISYDFTRNTENANSLIDEFAQNLKNIAIEYSEISSAIERARVYNDAFWMIGGERHVWDEKLSKDIQQLLTSYSEIESEYNSSISSYLDEINLYMRNREISQKNINKQQLEYINELKELKGLENQNIETKKRQLELVREIRKYGEGELSYLPDGSKIFNQYERRLKEVYKEFMNDFSKVEYMTLDGVEKGSIEHIKRLKHAIKSELKELPDEIQKEVMAKILSERYNIDINVNLVWDNAEKIGKPDAFFQELLQMSETEQKRIIEGADKELQQYMGAYKNGVLDVVESTHDEIRDEIPKVLSQKTMDARNLYENLLPSQKVVDKVENGWKKLNMINWFTPDINKTMEENLSDISKKRDEIGKILEQIAKSEIELSILQSKVANLNLFSTIPNSIEEIEKLLSGTAKPFFDFLFGKYGGFENTSSAAKSYASEFNTMINFIKKLNTETEKLGKTFDTHLSTDKYKSALEQVRKAYTSEFKSMPKEFQQMFSGLMENVDFSDRNVILQQLEQLKKLAQIGKYKKDAEEIVRNIEAVMSTMEAEMNIEFKVEDDKELQRQVEDAFGDYEITVELQKLGIDADTAKSFFGLDYTDLNKLQNKIFNMQKQFTGKNQVDEYRKYIDKLFKITDKANLEAVKKYSKYLQYEMSERVRIEMDYQRQMGEVYGSSAFSDEQKKDIVENLGKEMKKKLQKMDWDEFKATDYYIEMFQNLEYTSTSAINTMLYKLNQLKDSMSELDAAQMKEIAKQMEALEDEMIKRNPFKSLISSMKEWNAAKKAAKTDEGYLSILPPDYEIKSSGKLILDVIDEINKKLYKGTDEAENGLIELQNQYEKIWQAAKSRDTSLGSLSGMQDKLVSIGIDIKTGNIDEVKSSIEELTEKMQYYQRQLDALEKPETEDRGVASVWMAQISSIQSLLDILGQLESAYTTLGDDASMSAIDAEGQYKNLKQTVEGLIATLKRAQTDMANQKKAVKAIKELAQVFQQVNEKSKGVFDSIMENLDYLGSATDENTEAWKEFGDAIFDTVTSALTMIPMLVAGFDAAGTAINASMGIIGLIAEAIQLTITLVKALAKIHDNELEGQITKYTKKIDDLKKAYDRYQEAFDAAWDYNKMRRFYDLAQATAEQQIENYRNMIALEEEKKKSDEEKIEEWYNAIDDLQEELLDNREKIMNELGGFGSEEDMGSAAEQFASAWYDAFLETGSGLQALEDTFQGFLENIVKKQLLLQGSQAILQPLFDEINRMVGDGTADAQEMASIIDMWNNETIGRLNAYYESLGQMFQAAGVGGGLEGLQQGIQGVTEDTAEIIAAYMNTIRFDVAQQNNKLDTIVQTLQLDTATNPLIHNLRIVAQQTTDIREMLDSVVMANHPDGGSGIKVFMD